MDIAESLRQNREERSLKPRELAAALGINHQNVYRWESGKTMPSITMCVKIADFYDITIDELIGRKV